MSKNSGYLFRGFHPVENGTATITINGKEIKGEWLHWNMYGHCEEGFVERLATGYFISHFVKPHNVIPETVGQYANEKDKSGKRICDGDILLLGTGETRFVFFATTQFRHTAYGEYARDFSHKDKGYEIIGNMYENPDLLSRKTK